MNIENRLRRIEAAAAGQPDAADRALLDYHLAVIEIVYTIDDEAEQEAALMALGPRPAAVTESARNYLRALEMAYGEGSPLMEAM